MRGAAGKGLYPSAAATPAWARCQGRAGGTRVGGARRKTAPAYPLLCTHVGIRERAAAPGRGSKKGGVEAASYHVLTYFSGFRSL